MLGLAPWLRPARAAADTARGTPQLSGTEFNLEIAESPVNFTGTPRIATTING